MNGKAGNDLLIGGATNADNSLAALDELLATWDSGDASTIADELTVDDDDQFDSLHGSVGADLFWDGLGDELSDPDTDEGDLVFDP